MEQDLSQKNINWFYIPGPYMLGVAIMGLFSGALLTLTAILCYLEMTQGRLSDENLKAKAKKGKKETGNDQIQIWKSR